MDYRVDTNTDNGQIFTIKQTKKWVIKLRGLLPIYLNFRCDIHVLVVYGKTISLTLIIVMSTL